jgi:hypothetical protein
MRVKKLKQEKMDEEKTRRLQKHLDLQRMHKEKMEMIENAARKI